ncbi:MAG TPA: hypothetical protein VF974_07635 [Patescibacteria group bacterium]
MPSYFVAPTTDFYSTTLNGQVSATSSMIALASIGSLQVPGYVVIDRTTTGTPPSSTPSVRETIAFGSIASINILTGLTRGADGDTARIHADGALVETVWTTGMWNSLTSNLAKGMDINGLLNAITSPVSIQRIQTNAFYASIASLALLQISTRLDVSTASVTGWGYIPTFSSQGAYSGPTTAVGGLLVAPRPGALQWVSITAKYPASGGSVAFDFKLRGASIFANSTTLPAIAAGGTYVSIASIATRNINPGDLLQVDVASVAPITVIQGLVGEGGTL